jgi:hypothetical protein
MNKQLLLVGLLALPLVSLASVDSQICDANDDFTSKSIFRDNPQFSNGRPEFLSLYRPDRALLKKDGIWGSFEVVGFGGKSGSSDELARWFFPFRKTSLVVGEVSSVNDAVGGFIRGGSDAFKNNTHDIIANNFFINTLNHDFQSIISISPEQEYAGGGFNYHQVFTDDEDKGYWFDVTVPVVQVKQRMNLCETIINQGQPLNGSPRSMVQAFVNPDFKFGKICPGELKQTAVSDIEIRIGRDGARGNHCHYTGFIGIVVPTGNKPTAQWMFEPIVGRAGHFGIEWGSYAGYEFYHSEDFSIQANCDINNTWLFAADEVRSFDLVDKQWSRYIRVFTDVTATTSTPGINVFTKCMEIRPKGTWQVNSSFLMKYGKFEAEAGFNLYVRQSEAGKLTQPWTSNAAIAGTLGGSPGVPARSMSLASMRMWDNGLVQDDADQSLLATNPANNTLLYRPIRGCDLNLQSALHPACVAQTVYATVGYNNEVATHPAFASLGTSYQFSHNNAAMNRWTIWGKFGFSV